MSIDRKKRLRKLAGTLMGLVGLTTPGQKTASGIETNPQQQQQNSTSKLLAGTAVVGTTAVALGAGLSLYDRFGKKQSAEDAEYKKLILETARDEKESKEKERKLEENRKRVREQNGLTNDDEGFLLTNLNNVLGGTGLTKDMILANLDTPESKKLIEEGKKNVANNADCQRKLVEKIAEIIRDNLTEEKVKKALGRLEELKGEGENKEAIGDAMITSISWDGGGNNAWITTWNTSTGRDGNVNVGIHGNAPAQHASECHGTNKALDARQLMAGDELLPEGLKGLLGGRLPVAVMLPKLSSLGAIGGANVQISRDDVLKTWRPVEKGGRDAQASNGRALARTGQVELDLVIGKGLTTANLGANVPVARIGIGQIDDKKNKNMTRTAKEHCYAAIAQCVDKVGFGI